MFRVIIIVPIALIGFAIPTPTSLADDIQDKLTKRHDIYIAVKASAADVQRFLSEKLGCKVEFDYDAFDKEKLKIGGDQELFIPKMPNMFGDTMLRLIASQIRGVYEIRDGAVWIVPNVKDGKPRSFPPYTKALDKARRELRQRVENIPVDVEKDVDAPIEDIVDFISDRFDLVLIIDFIELKGLGNKRAHINAGKSNFDDLMKQMLKDVEATYRIEPDHIRIVRQRKS
jgi:hypothetical protein